MRMGCRTMVKKAASERCKAKTKARKGHDKGDR
jgi:hypothetical protein